MSGPAVHRIAVAVTALAVLTPATAVAQLDPLLFLKGNSPNVIVAVDVSARMQTDAAGTYLDPGTYTRTGEPHEAVLGLLGSDSAKTYRRKFFDFEHRDALLGPGDKFGSSHIEAVGDLEAEYATFFERTRLAVARRGLIRGLDDNAKAARFALIKMRQASATLSGAGNDYPLGVTDLAQQSGSELQDGKWKITRPTVLGANSLQLTSGLLTSASAENANATIRATLAKGIGESGALLAASADAHGVIDAPVGLLLDDARLHASALINADIAAGGCRNTIVIMVTGGAEGTIASQDIAVKASSFLSVSGRRVPIYVVALAPAASEVETLQAVASNSGGRYYEVTGQEIDAVASGDPVPALVRAINTAVQHALVESTVFNLPPTAQLPFGPSSERQVTSPIVGTVNLRGASRMGSTGLPETLPDSETYLLNGTTEIPQRSNVMVTTGFVLPGFEARVRAFRLYKPVPDPSRPAGFRFSQDGTRLWVNSAPAPGSRNIYTVLPGSSAMVPFTAANAGTLDDYLGVNDATALIDFIRQQPMGAVLGSTPAFLDPPSLDPPPDPEYPAFREANKDRRTLIFVGANDGMLHALDARTGVEVWAFIPFNLLPKLRALRHGQSLDAFSYFVDSSPKISDVKVGNQWRTFVFFGQGPGGTFYNTLDVTLDSMGDTVSATSSSDTALLAYFAVDDRITWKWSFPRNSSFDHTLAPYGELSANGASTVEKTIGETWSDPAIGQVQNEAGPYVMVAGSGFLRYSVETAYRSGVTRAGTTFYVLDVATGNVLGSPRDVGADSFAETADDCRAAGDCRRMKNALQMDPVATGVGDRRFITKVYIGDLDGKVWRFGLDSAGSGVVNLSTPTLLYDAGADHPLFASMATVNVGSTNHYLFLGTGSDLLPSDNVNYSYSLLVLLDTGGSATKTAEILLERTDWPPAAGNDEKVTAFPAVAGDIVFFTTTSHSPTTPCTPFSANLYAFTFIGGPAYDTNNDGQLSTGTSGSTGGKGKDQGSGGGGAPADSTKVFTTAGARATAPFIVDQHLVFSAGGKIELFGDPDDFNNGVGQAGVRLLSWRVVK
jgi:hypothetical protein